jgi:hypothetical protein
MFEVVSRGLGARHAGPPQGGGAGETEWHTRDDLRQTAANQLKMISFFTYPSGDLPPNRPHLTRTFGGGDLMEVCTVGADVVPDGHADRAFVLLRRVGVVVGVLFGLGLLAVLMADHASAEQSATQQVDDTGGLGQLTNSLTKPVVEAVAPVTEPLLRPVVAAVAPAAAPVIEARVVVSGGRSSSAPVVWFAEPVAVHSGPSMAPFAPAPQQDVLGPPVHYAVTGGGAVGGSGGAHGADVLPSVSDGVRSGQDTQVRAPPGTVVGAAWFAYDDRDHPS